MENVRLKNIIIMILLLLNVFLLLLVLAHHNELRRSERALRESTLTLLNEGGVAIDRRLLNGKKVPPSCILSRDEKKERAFAAALLGAAVEVSARGNAAVYRSECGEAVFYPNGSFRLRADDIASEQFDAAAAFLQRACRYSVEDARAEQGVVRAMPYYDDLPVFEAQIVFVFEGDALRSASGYFLPSAGGERADGETINRCSATVALMDYCRDEGEILDSIAGISGGYLLQSTVSAPLLLSPVYRIDTGNGYGYYVNAATGHISPAA